MWRPSKVSPSDARSFFSFPTLFLAYVLPSYEYHFVSPVLFSIESSYEAYSQRILTNLNSECSTPERKSNAGFTRIVWCQKVNLFAAGNVLLVAERSVANRKKTMKSSTTDREYANGFQRAYSICLGGRAAAMLWCGYQQIRDATSSSDDELREWAWCPFATSSKIQRNRTTLLSRHAPYFIGIDMCTSWCIRTAQVIERKAMMIEPKQTSVTGTAERTHTIVLDGNTKPRPSKWPREAPSTRKSAAWRSSQGQEVGALRVGSYNIARCYM